MNKNTLEGRMKFKKEETIQLLKQEARYIEFNEDFGFMYELKKQVYGKLNRIVIGLKKGDIKVHAMEEIN